MTGSDGQQRVEADCFAIYEMFSPKPPGWQRIAAESARFDTSNSHKKA